MNEELKKFFHSVRNAFPIYRKQEKRFYSDFCSSVNEFAAAHPDCTEDDLNNKFGNPKDIAIMYYNNMDSDVYFTILKRTRYIKRIYIACIAVLTVMFITTLCFLMSAKNSFDNASLDGINVNLDTNETINN